MPKQYIEIIVALIIIVIGAMGLPEAMGYPGQSGYVPMAVLIFTIFLAVIWLIQIFFSLRRKRQPLDIERAQLKRFLIFFVAALLYGVCFSLIGFYTSTFLLIPLAAGCLGYRKWKVSISTAVVFLVILNVVFNLMLKTPLPPELIFRLKGLL